jgi:hypothetical protein
MGLIAGLDQLPAPRPASVPFYVDDRDVLAVHVWNNQVTLTLRIWARILDLDGIIQTVESTVTPATNLIHQVFRTPLIAGYLLTVGVYPVSGTPIRGQVWGIIALERTPSSNNLHTATLARGYITEFDSLAWPATKFDDSVEGPGYTLNITGFSSGAGYEQSWTVAASQRWQAFTVVLALTTSAAAATRQVHLHILSGATVLCDIPSETTQAASLTYTYYFGPFGYAPAPVGTNVYVALPGVLPVMAGWKIATLTDNLQSGDQYSTPSFMVSQWIEP